MLVGLRRGKERDQLGKKGPQVQGRAWGALEAWQGQPFGEEVGFSSKKKKSSSFTLPSSGVGPVCGSESCQPPAQKSPPVFPSWPCLCCQPPLSPLLPPWHLLTTGWVSGQVRGDHLATLPLGSMGLWAPESLAWLQAQAHQALWVPLGRLDPEPLGPVPPTSCRLQLPEGGGRCCWGAQTQSAQSRVGLSPATGCLPVRAARGPSSQPGSTFVTAKAQRCLNVEWGLESPLPEAGRTGSHVKSAIYRAQ